MMTDYDAPAPAPTSVDDLNGRAGFQAGTRHLVVKKTEPAALASLLNWGLRVGWFKDPKEAQASMWLLSDDFDAYYSFWETLNSGSPNLVQIIDFEAVPSPEILSEKLLKLGITAEASRKKLKYSRAPVSGRSRGPRAFSESTVTKILGDCEKRAKR